MTTDASGGGRPAAERLRELQRLHDDGLISDEEFEAQRARILDEAFGPGQAGTASGSSTDGPDGSAADRPSDQIATASSLPEDQPKPDPPGEGVVNPARWPDWLRITAIVVSGVWIVTLPFMLWQAARYTWLPYLGVATAVILVLAIAAGAAGDEADQPAPAPAAQPADSATPALPEPTPTRTPVPATTPSPVPTSTATPEPTPTGTPTIGEALIAFTFCERLRVDLGMKWGQAPGLAYSGDPRVSGDLEEGDYIRIHTRPNDAGEIRVKVYPHDGRTVGKTDDMVWISWSGLVHPARLDQVALVCEETVARTPSPTPEPTPTRTPEPTPTRTPEPTPTPDVEDCFSPWDGNLDALEDLVRPGLNDEGSMQTHETRFSRDPDADGYHLVRMEYSANNLFGARVKTVAIGKVRARNCHVILIDPGY